MLRDTLRDVFHLWNSLASLIFSELCLPLWDTPKCIRIPQLVVFGGKEGKALQRERYYQKMFLAWITFSWLLPVLQ